MELGIYSLRNMGFQHLDLDGTISFNNSTQCTTLGRYLDLDETPRVLNTAATTTNAMDAARNYNIMAFNKAPRDNPPRIGL